VDTEKDNQEESDTEMETTSKQPLQVLKKRKKANYHWMYNRREPLSKLKLETGTKSLSSPQ
jgi:hypothetical protein